jgi:hypothetical protein
LSDGSKTGKSTRREGAEGYVKGLNGSKRRRTHERRRRDGSGHGEGALNKGEKLKGGTQRASEGKEKRPEECTLCTEV